MEPISILTLKREHWTIVSTWIILAHGNMFYLAISLHMLHINFLHYGMRASFVLPCATIFYLKISYSFLIIVYLCQLLLAWEKMPEQRYTGLETTTFVKRSCIIGLREENLTNGIPGLYYNIWGSCIIVS